MDHPARFPDMAAPKQEIRPARANDRALLDAMTLAGIRHWGHDESHPGVYREFESMVRGEEGPENHPVFVLEEDGAVVGFYELRDRGDHIELLRMFLAVERIGRGYGRSLWIDAVATAAKSHDQMVILSDPGARGFYEAMGASLDGEIEAAPGFVLGNYHYDLTQHHP